MRIIFIGYRCTGKTVLSKALAKKLDIKRFSTDAMIEESIGTTISKYVEQNGWGKFREKETEIIKSLENEDNIIIDCGGGVIENEENMISLRKNSKIIWLKSTIEKIKRLIHGDGTRPSLTGGSNVDEIDIIYKRREPLYLRYSDFSIDTTDWDEEAFIQELIDKTEV